MKEHTPFGRFPQKTGKVVGVDDVIIQSNFGLNNFRGFRSTGDQNFRFPIDFASHDYNSAAATAQTVMWPTDLCNLCQRSPHIELGLRPWLRRRWNHESRQRRQWIRMKMNRAVERAIETDIEEECWSNVNCPLCRRSVSQAQLTGRAEFTRQFHQVWG